MLDDKRRPLDRVERQQFLALIARRVQRLAIVENRPPAVHPRLGRVTPSALRQLRNSQRLDGDGGDDVGAVDPESRVLTTTIYLSLKNLKLLQKKFFFCARSN